MAEDLHLNPLTGHREFDGLITEFAALRDDGDIAAMREQIWEQFGTEGAVFISDMASFSSTSRLRSLRSTWTARHSRVCSSMIVSILIGWPLLVRSITKS